MEQELNLPSESALQAPPATPSEAALPEADPVTAALERFRVITNPTLRVLVAYLAPAIAILLLADWLVGSKAFAGDLLRLPAVLVSIAELVILNSLFDKLPAALQATWTQGLVHSTRPAQPVKPAFLAYLRRFEATLNSHPAWLVGLIFALAGLYATFPVLAYLSPSQYLLTPEQLLAYYLWGSAGIVIPLLGYLFGLLAWRAAIIALFVYRLGRDFELQIVINHPDQSGGLRPLGDLCLTIAYALLLPAALFSYWGIAAAYFNLAGADIIISLWAGLFRKWLVVLVILAFLLFFQPLYQIHLQMLKQQQALRDELGRLSQKMNQLSLELRAQADTISTKLGAEKLEQLEFMEKVYQKNYRVPTWPVDTNILVKFSLAQVVPILSLVGTSKPIIELINSLLSPLRSP